MIRIAYNGISKVVTKGAYESFYKPLGYEIVPEKSTTSKVEVKNDEPIKNNESDKKNATKKEVSTTRKTNEEK